MSDDADESRFTLRCAHCGATVTLLVVPSTRFYDLTPARGWNWDGASREWSCAACAEARRQRKGEAG